MEMFDFSPKDVLEAISIQDYLVFLTYSLEYRAIVMEQMSHEREQEYLKEYPNPADRREGYGVVLLDYTIRDLKGRGNSFFITYIIICFLLRIMLIQ